MALETAAISLDSESTTPARILILSFYHVSVKCSKQRSTDGAIALSAFTYAKLANKIALSTEERCMMIVYE